MLKAVGFDQLCGRVGDAAHLYRIDVAHTCLQREKGKQPSACAEIHDHVAGLQGAVNRFAVGIAPNLVQEQSLLQDRAGKLLLHPRLLEYPAVEPAPELPCGSDSTFSKGHERDSANTAASRLRRGSGTRGSIRARLQEAKRAAERCTAMPSRPASTKKVGRQRAEFCRLHRKRRACWWPSGSSGRIAIRGTTPGDASGGNR